MTILCITTTGLPGIRPCTVRGAHKVTCHSHDGWSEKYRDELCTGCFPREADRGFLCQRCYERIESAWIRWPRFELALRGVDRAVQVDTAGVRGSSQGYVPFAGTFLALDECTRYLASMPVGVRAMDLWISDEAGARDAVLFAHAAERAYRSHRIEEQEAKLRRVRCPRCGQLSLVRRAPISEGAELTIRCDTDGCGHIVHEDDVTYGRVFQDADSGQWLATLEPTIDVLDAIERRSA